MNTIWPGSNYGHTQNVPHPAPHCTGLPAPAPRHSICSSVNTFLSLSRPITKRSLLLAATVPHDQKETFLRKVGALKVRTLQCILGFLTLAPHPQRCVSGAGTSYPHLTWCSGGPGTASLLHCVGGHSLPGYWLRGSHHRSDPSVSSFPGPGCRT